MLAVRVLALLSLLLGLLSVTGRTPAPSPESGHAITTGSSHEAPFATLDARESSSFGAWSDLEPAAFVGRFATVTRRFFELPAVARPATAPPLRWALADGPKTERGPPRRNRGA